MMGIFRYSLTVVAPRMLGRRWRLQLLAYLRLRGTSFPVQEALLRWVLHQRIVRELAIDASGMGMPLAEALARDYGSRARGVQFTAPTKEALATGLAVAYEKGLLYHRADRDLRSQIYAVKRSITASGNLVYRATDADDHHADAFWSLALAIENAPREGVAQAMPSILFGPRRS